MIHRIRKYVLDQMAKDAVDSFPDECCGFVFGKENGADRELLDVMVVNNSKDGDKRRRFEIGALDYLKAERHAEEKDLSLLGVYHSHPNHPAVPSEHDRVSAQPFFSYLILSVIEKEFAGLRSWRLNEDRVFEEETIYDHQLI